MTPHHQIARWLAESRSAVAFTGAGISTESDIPAFRTPGGVWSKYRQVYFDEFLASPAARQEYWRQKCEAHEAMSRAEPNAGHRALAEWETAGRVRGLITQNIDGLHVRAGSRNVLELHGTAMAVTCLDCGARYDVEPLVVQFQSTGEVPKCTHCPSGRLKHATISFGQSLPEDVLAEASRWAKECDLFFALGSSLVVYPAAALPDIARQSGARLVIINHDPTPLDSQADVVLREGLGAALGAIGVAWRKIREGAT
ncbi:MAG: sigma factor regulator FecR [Planctomycetia bacterium]|nr:sigma factor regulator FecR [Planctomycetia bacterium]